MASQAPVIPRLSAAIMLLRAAAGLEVFMVRRHVRSEFAPDVYVFPGGAVAPADGEAEVTPGVAVPSNAPNAETALGVGVRAAAIRELFEEAGVLLAMRDGRSLAIDAGIADRLATYRARLQQRTMTIAEVAAAEDIVLATDALTHCAHWITPEAFPKRFDTHFFLAEHPSDQEATFDDLETSGGQWIAPGAALERYEAGEFPLVFATIHQLRALAKYATSAAAIDAWRGRVPPVIMPRVALAGGREVILLPGEAAPEQAGG